MQDQLANAKATKDNNNVHNDELLAQVENWRPTIDKIYNDIRTAQENYYTMSSKEKLLKLRTKYKEYTEHSRKMFNIDGDFMKRVSFIQCFLLFKF